MNKETEKEKDAREKKEDKAEKKKETDGNKQEEVKSGTQSGNEPDKPLGPTGGTNR